MNQDINEQAAKTWQSASPDPSSQRQPAMFETVVARESQWQWGWNRWIGIHYGPIPVGIIIGIPLFIWIRTS